MTNPLHNILKSRVFLVFMMFVGFVFLSLPAHAQCPGPGTTLTGDLQGPSKLVQSNVGNLIVAETGTPAPNSGRVSIVGLDGSRRSLLEGLPSGRNSNGDFSGTQGVFLQGRTLYILNGEGNATVPGPIPGVTEDPNPNPNSPILSSILAVHFSAAAEKNTSGFVLTLPDHQALKNGEKLNFSNGGADKITVELVADFPDYVPDPLPFYAPNVRHSNPFGITGIGNQLFVSDGGRNLVFKIDADTGAFSTLATFAPIPNPTFPPPPPVIEAVPDNVREYNGQLLVTLLRGFPFLAGNSAVVKVDPSTGAITPFISGLTSAIDVLPVKTKGATNFLTLEISLDLQNGAPGRLQRFATPAGPGTVISNCLIGPSNMVRDEKTGTLYITSIFTGRIIQLTSAQVGIPFAKSQNVTNGGNVPAAPPAPAPSLKPSPGVKGREKDLRSRALRDY
jgi:hypothetical protein